MASVIAVPEFNQSFLPHYVSGHSEAHWFGVYTRVNQEKKVATQFLDRGIQHFLPTFRDVRRRSDRRVILELPLFPGYLFVRISSDEKRRVLQVPRVVRLLGTGSSQCVIPDEEIEMLQTGLRDDRTALPFNRLRKGTRVRVLRGPFSGQEGILIMQKNKFRLVLSVQLIHQSFSVEIGQEDVELMA